jgi:hypothetical protein
MGQLSPSSNPNLSPLVSCLDDCPVNCPTNKVEVVAVVGETSKGARQSDMARLKQMLEEDIPNLRRTASPQLNHPGAGKR